MKEFDIKLGEIIRAEREKRDISQQQIADALGCTNAAVSNWETGRRAMYAETLRRYCQYYAEQCHIFVGILWGFLQNKKAVN